MTWTLIEDRTARLLAYAALVCGILLGAGSARADPVNPDLQELHLKSMARQSVTDSARLDAWWRDYDIWLSGFVAGLEGFALSYGRLHEGALFGDCAEVGGEGPHSMYSLDADRLLEWTIERFIVTNGWLSAKYVRVGDVVVSDFIDRFLICVAPSAAVIQEPPPGQTFRD